MARTESTMLALGTLAPDFALPDVAHGRVITRDGIHADALSTAVFVLGVEQGLALLAQLPFHAEAVIVGPDCVLHATPGTADRLRFRMPPDANGVLPRCVGRP